MGGLREKQDDLYLTSLGSINGIITCLLVPINGGGATPPMTLNITTNI